MAGWLFSNSVRSTSAYTRSKRSSGKLKSVTSSHNRSSSAWRAGSDSAPSTPLTRRYADAPSPSASAALPKDARLASRAQRSSMNFAVSGR